VDPRVHECARRTYKHTFAYLLACDWTAAACQSAATKLVACACVRAHGHMFESASM